MYIAALISKFILELATVLSEKCTQKHVCDVGSCVVRKLCLATFLNLDYCQWRGIVCHECIVRACIPQPLKCLVDMQHNLKSFHGPPRANE
jgi:hypothetical protein